jgi:hypothetical protein
VWVVPSRVYAHSKFLQKQQSTLNIQTDVQYGLSDMIDLAEERNPKTHAGWEKANYRIRQ